MTRRLRLRPEDIIAGLDLAGEEHQAVICRAEGERLTRFRVPHSLRGFDDLLLRTRLLASQSTGRRVFAFEATGHVWEALAHYLETRGEEYVIVNPLATFRLREARQMNRRKTDVSDAEQIAELVRNDLITETKLEVGPYLELRRAWGEYARLREERARLKTLLSHQLYGVFPELRSVWNDLFTPGCLAVLRLGLSPHEIAALPVNDFIGRAKDASRGRRLWRFKLIAVHEWAERTVVPATSLGPLARELARLVERADLLTYQIDELAKEIQERIAFLEEARYLLQYSRHLLVICRRHPGPHRLNRQIPARPAAHQTGGDQSLSTRYRTARRPTSRHDPPRPGGTAAGPLYGDAVVSAA